MTDSEDQDPNSPLAMGGISFTDDPIAGSADDVLGRETFADAIQRILQGLRSRGASAVLGLQGPWGSGKSSVLNLLQPKLEQDGQWKTTRFNPWEVSDLESLLRGFFTSLIDALPEDLQKEGRRQFAQYATGIASLLPEVNLGIIKFSTQRAAEAITGGDSLAVRRERTESLLSRVKTPIVVLLDDLDRLHPDELLTVFKLVRLVGRLPNVFYVLAFDEESIVAVLKNTAVSGGSEDRARSYLEKIVQVRIDLPGVHESQLSELLNEGIGRILEVHGIDAESVDFSEFANQYQGYLKRRLAEPRSVKRYLAQVEAYYPLVEDEVDFGDYLLVTFLRVFHPAIYRDLPHRKGDLVRSLSSVLGGQPDLTKVREGWEKWVRNRGVGEDEVEEVLTLLASLFRPIKSAMEDVVFGGHGDDELSGSRRVGSDEYFDRYFQHAVPPDDIPDSIVREAAEELVEGVVGDATVRLMSEASSKGDRLLVKIERQLPLLDPIAKERLLHLLASLAGDLSDTAEFIFLSPRDRAEILASRILNELVTAGHAWEIDKILADPASLRFVSMVTRRALHEARRGGDVPPTLQQLIETVVSQVKPALRSAMDKPFEESESDTQFLFDLFDFEGRDDARKWLRENLPLSQWSVEDLVALAVGVYRSGSERTVGDLSKETLEDFFDLDELRQTLGPMDDLSEPPGSLLHDLPATLENRGWVGKWVLKKMFEKESGGTDAADGAD